MNINRQTTCDEPAWLSVRDDVVGDVTEVDVRDGGSGAFRVHVAVDSIGTGVISRTNDD